MSNKVYLVGAGPGDEQLITQKGLDALKKSDVIVYDRLANPSLLNYSRDDAELIYVGKASSDHTLSQEEINQLIVDKAKEGKMVCRLKGGDPYVFGRGGEEGQFLLENGLDFEIVPGITSAIGGLAYAGIPITHRDYASSFHVFTGHFKSEDRDHNWESVSKLKGTLVFLMGLSNIEKICESLIEHGYDKDQKAAVIMEATRPSQRVVTGTVSTIARIAREKAIKSPALVVIGGVVNLHGQLSTPLDGYLNGKKVLVTRARKQSSDMVSKLKSEGADVLELPAIKINEIVSDEEFTEVSKNLSNYSHIIFTSVNGVKIFMDKLFENNMDSRKLASAKLVAIGPSTAGELKKYGLIADLLPPKYVAESVYETIKDSLDENSSVLIPRAKNARSYLIDVIGKDHRVDELLLYSADPEEVDLSVIEQIKESEIDYVTFASSSTVKNFFDMINKNDIDISCFREFISIGPVTSKTLRDYGIENYKEASEYTIDGIISEIKKTIEGENIEKN